MCTLVCTTNVARLMRKIHVIGSTLGPRGARDKRENLLKSGCATESAGVVSVNLRFEPIL